MVEKGTLKRIGETVSFFIVWTLIWIVIIHGVFVLLLTAVSGLLIYGSDFKSIGELAAYTTLYSLVASTPVLALNLLLPDENIDSFIDRFIGWYLVVGYFAGAIVVLLTIVGLFMYRAWLWSAQMPQLLMLSPKTGAQGFALFAIAAAVIIGGLEAFKEEGSNLRFLK